MKNIIVLTTLLFVTNLLSQSKIEKIEFVSEGYANAPDYDLIIYCNKIAILNARSDNYKIITNGSTVGYGTDNNGIDIRKSEIKGLFLTKLKSKNYKEILDLIHKLNKEFDIKNFNNNKLHNSIGELKVIYKTGEIEYIYDAGMNGPKDLVRLYTYLKNLRFNQKWE